MKILIFNPKKGTFEEKTLTKEESTTNLLQTYYKIINCDTIEIVGLSINNTNIDIIIDEEGKLKDKWEVSGIINKPHTSFLAGTLIFNKLDEQSNYIGLSEEDITAIKNITHLLKSAQTQTYALLFSDI